MNDTVNIGGRRIRRDARRLSIEVRSDAELAELSALTNLRDVL